MWGVGRCGDRKVWVGEGGGWGGCRGAGGKGATLLELKRDIGMAESALTRPASSSEVRNHELLSIGTDVSNAFVICSVRGTDRSVRGTGSTWAGAWGSVWAGAWGSV